MTSGRLPRRSWVPWLIFGISLALVGLSLHFALQNAPYLPPEDRIVFLDLVWAAAIMAFPASGAVIASRRPRQPIGWILVTMGACLGVGLFTSEYVTYSAFAGNATLPFVPGFAWLTRWIWAGVFGLPIFLLLLFPTGHLPSPRWRPLAWVGGVALGIGTVADAFKPGPTGDISHALIDNPLGIESLGGVLKTVSSVSLTIFFFALLLSALAPIIRFRAARGDERQQLKWFATAAVLFLVVGASQAALVSLTEFSEETEEIIATVTFVVVALFAAGAIMVGILKYRLYDIDVVINRTLVYGSLTIILAMTYVASILLLQRVLPLNPDSDVAIAASTLAVAGLFGPARRRVQAFIDRRFYRSRYDAARTMEEFVARLRDEIDLTTLEREMVGVIERTVQPRSTSLWLRATSVEEGAR